MPRTVSQEALRRLVEAYAEERGGSFKATIGQEDIVLKPGDKHLLVEGGIETVREVLRDVLAVPSYIEALIMLVRDRQEGSVHVRFSSHTAVEAELR